jgi:two-component system nitrate/nitrite sensor histidine kinase NarX
MRPHSLPAGSRDLHCADRTRALPQGAQSRYAMDMSSAVSLSTKLIRIGAALLVLALASIGLTLWVTWQLEGGAAAVNETGRMRMQTWRLTSSVQAHRPPAEVQALVQRFDDSLSLLREGDATRPLFVPWDDDVRREFTTVDRLWQNQRALWTAPLAPDDPLLLNSADEFVHAIDRLVLAIEHQLSGFTALLNLFQFAMMALAIGGAVVMLYTG